MVWCFLLMYPPKVHFTVWVDFAKLPRGALPCFVLVGRACRYTRRPWIGASHPASASRQEDDPETASDGERWENEDDFLVLLSVLSYRHLLIQARAILCVLSLSMDCVRSFVIHLVWLEVNTRVDKRVPSLFLRYCRFYTAVTEDRVIVILSVDNLYFVGYPVVEPWTVTPVRSAFCLRSAHTCSLSSHVGTTSVNIRFSNFLDYTVENCPETTITSFAY